MPTLLTTPVTNLLYEYGRSCLSIEIVLRYCLGVRLQLGDFSERIRNTPSILRLDSLRLVGDVWFGKDVVLQVRHPISIIFKSKIVSLILLKLKVVKSDPNVLYSRARL